MNKHNVFICELARANINDLIKSGVNGKINNSNMLELSCVDSFIKNISFLHKTDKGFIGLSYNEPFVFTTEHGIFRDKNALKRQSNHKVIMLDTVKGTQSRIVLESLLAFLDEIVTTGMVRDTYINLRGNCLGNEAVHDKPLGRTEIVTNNQNLDHGRTWNKIYEDCGIVVEFSATDKDFKEYIRASQFDITEKYLLNYSDGIIEEVKDGWIDYRVTPSSDNGV